MYVRIKHGMPASESSEDHTARTLAGPAAPL